MADTSSIQIYVGSAHGHPTAIEVSRRAREICPLLRSLTPGSSLPMTFITPLRIVLAYLDGDTALKNFTRFNRDTSILLLFATTWSLAARLHLPDLQNLLVSAMAGIYTQCIQHRLEYPADAHVDHAFSHLRADVGPCSHAEALLICFIGRTAPMIPALIKQLKLYRFDKDISEKILFEARSFAPDPIQNDIARFQVDIAYAPQYAPIEIQHASPLDGRFGCLPVSEKIQINLLDCSAEGKRAGHAKWASYVPPYAETVSSHDTLDEDKPVAAKNTQSSFNSHILATPTAKAMNFVGQTSTLEKLKYMDLVPAVPARDLMVFPGEFPDPLHPGSAPMPHVPNAAATAAAYAALRPPPPPRRRATPVAPIARDILSLPADFRCRVRIERADSVTEERGQPEVPTVEPTRPEVQAQPQVQTRSDVQTQPEVQTQSEATAQPEIRTQPEVRTESIVQANGGDSERVPGPRRASSGQRQGAMPDNTQPTNKRTSWLRDIFPRCARGTAPEPNSSLARRTNPGNPPPPIYSEGGTWAYVRTNGRRGCHAPAWPSNSNDDEPRPSPVRSQRQLTPPNRPGGGDGREITSQSPPRPPPSSGDGNGGRSHRSLSTYREDELEAWGARRKMGSRTGFALMSFNRRRYDE